MTGQFEDQADALAALLVAGEFRAAERTLDAVRELAWHRRASEVRARRHAGPGPLRASFGRPVLRRKPRTHAISAGEASDLITRGRLGA